MDVLVTPSGSSFSQLFGETGVTQLRQASLATPLLALPNLAAAAIVKNPLCPDNTAGRLLSSFPSSVPPRTQPFGLPHSTSEERAVVVGASYCSFDFLPVETAAHRETAKIAERIGAKLA